jgi:hypothetical protein
MEMKKLKLSINTRIVDKNIGGDKRAFREGWCPAELTLSELAESIDAGYAFGPQFDGGIRKGDNFICAGFLVIDVDGTMPLEDAYLNPYIQKYGSIIYTTPSHLKDDKDRFRVVFATETAIESGPKYKFALLGLAEKFNTDRSIADAARILYGSRNSHPTIIGNVITDAELKNIIRQGRAADKLLRLEKTTTEDAPSAETIQDCSNHVPVQISPTMLLRLSNGTSAFLTNLPKQTPIFCPFHADGSPSAFTLRSQKGSAGVHCSTCRKTWWVEGSQAPTYDFYAFDRIVKKTASDYVSINKAREALGKEKLNKEAIVINERFLPPLKLTEGMTLVKSPKGSGKTTALKQLVRTARANGKSVLLIGHRQTLLRELSNKLGLHCYLDDRPYFPGMKKQKRPDHYAISVDSLPKRLSKPRSYDVVIIDESEQVFSHITAKTIRNAHAVMTRLQTYVSDAKSIYLFDADLNNVTLSFAISCRRKNASQPVRMILNTFTPEKRECELYQSTSALIVDMTKAARAGKRIFVACNSKARAKIFAKMLRKDIGDKLRLLLVTAEDKASREVQEFLSDIPTKILQYDVVVASPAIGTGIDITFPGGAQEIDVLYGFFNPGINSHYDVDQQLGRVRNPKSVKVWISGRRSSFEIDLDAVKLDLVQTGDTHPAVTGFDGEMPMVNMNHPLLTLQATAYCAQRASQNRMKDYFIKHKELNGWNVIIAKKDETDKKVITEKIKVLKQEIEKEYIEGILSARTIEFFEWEEYFKRRGAGDAIGLAATNEMIRFEIESFYNEPVTAGLVELDAHGRFRICVDRYERLYIRGQDNIRYLKLNWASYASKKEKFSKALGTRPLRSMEAILLSCGMVGKGGLSSDKTLSKSDLDGFLALCNERKVTIERDLDVSLRKDRHRDPVKTLNMFLELIGLQVVCVGKTRKKGAATYKYQLEPGGLKQITDIVERRRKGDRCTAPETLDPPRPKRQRPLSSQSGEANLFSEECRG